MGQHQHLPKNPIFLIAKHVFELIQLVFVGRFHSDKYFGSVLLSNIHYCTGSKLLSVCVQIQWFEHQRLDGHLAILTDRLMKSLLNN